MATNEHGWVVDASVILKWSLRDSAEDFLEEADALAEAYLDGRIDMVAPCYARYEVANGLAVARLQQRIGLREAQARLDWFLRSGISEPDDDDSLLLQAMDVAMAHSITLYDAIYVALSERHRYLFVTADQKLHKRAAPQIDFVRWIGDIRDLA